jgi:nucleotide-binding universal stress UspA family protein
MSASPRIVVAVDGSPASRAALRWAAHLAATAPRTRIEAVLVWEQRGHRVGQGPATPANFWNPREDAEKNLEAAVSAAFATAERPAGLTSTVLEGFPSDVLVDISRGAHLLVMGSRGHGGLRMLGSVSASCAERSRCPVLVVHAGDEPPA